MAAANFSATMMTGMCVLPLGTVGMIDASATRKPSTPWTRPVGSQLRAGHRCDPMRHVPHIWPVPVTYSLTKSGDAVVIAATGRRPSAFAPVAATVPAPNRGLRSTQAATNAPVRLSARHAIERIEPAGIGNTNGSPHISPHRPPSANNLDRQAGA